MHRQKQQNLLIHYVLRVVFRDVHISDKSCDKLLEFKCLKFDVARLFQ